MNFGCFLYEVTETFVQFLENITMFCKTSLRYKKHVFYLFSALSITVLELRLNR